MNEWLNEWRYCSSMGEQVLLPEEVMSDSQAGGLVSPTDRPTISATTAIRINIANARKTNFCQAKKMYLSRVHIEVHNHFVLPLDWKAGV